MARISARSCFRSVDRSTSCWSSSPMRARTASSRAKKLLVASVRDAALADPERNEVASVDVGDARLGQLGVRYRALVVVALVAAAVVAVAVGGVAVGRHGGGWLSGCGCQRL